MKRKHILYLTTNSNWGGSEILWTESANRFIEKGFFVKAGTFYDFDFVKHSLSGKEQYIDLRKRYNRPGIILRIIGKFRLARFTPVDQLLELVNKHKPDVAIISHGSLRDSIPLMQFCKENNIPFINLVHIVSESVWPGLDDKRIEQLNNLFSAALINYFVSRYTKEMHERILGVKLTNAGIAYNPFIKSAAESVKFPSLKDGLYKVALIGRLENFHKGYDLLIDVVKKEKWRNRNISFSIYGRGPHYQLLKRMIRQYYIQNVFVKDYVDDIAEIWKENHILMMPSRMEGQSLSLIEAMRFKRAAIVTNVGGVKELIEDGKSGFIADYPSAEHLDLTLERAWHYREEWEQMGHTAFEHIQQKHPKDATAYFNNQVENLISESQAKPLSVTQRIN